MAVRSEVYYFPSYLSLLLSFSNTMYWKFIYFLLKYWRFLINVWKSHNMYMMIWGAENKNQIFYEKNYAIYLNRRITYHSKYFQCAWNQAKSREIDSFLWSCNYQNYTFLYFNRIVKPIQTVNRMTNFWHSFSGHSRKIAKNWWPNQRAYQ